MSNPNGEMKDAIEELEERELGGFEKLDAPFERLLRVHMLLHVQRHYSRTLLAKVNEAERVAKSNYDKLAASESRVKEYLPFVASLRETMRNYGSADRATKARIARAAVRIVVEFFETECPF